MAMPYYRFVAYTSNSNAEDLGSMEFRDEVEARAFANQVIRDLIETQAELYLGWTLDIYEGERALPSIPFVTANCVGYNKERPRSGWRPGLYVGASVMRVIAI